METVVLVHGLWLGSWVMGLMGKRLRRCGFQSAFFSYPSMSSSLSENALMLARFTAGLPHRGYILSVTAWAAC